MFLVLVLKDLGRTSGGVLCLVFVCVCVCVCVGRFFWVNGGSVMMPVVTSRRVIMVLALFGVDPLLGNGWRI